MKVRETGNPQNSIGVRKTSVGPAQLLHCYKHRDSVAIALFVLPIKKPKWEYYVDLDWEVPDGFGDIQYLSPIFDDAKIYRMISSMGLCTKCVEDAMKTEFDWLKLTFIVQEVKNWATNTTQNFGAFGGDTESLDFYKLHFVSHVDYELSFIGQIQSVVRVICPTCILDTFRQVSFRSTRSVRTQHLLYGTYNIGRANLLAEPPSNI